MTITKDTIQIKAGWQLAAYFNALVSQLAGPASTCAHIHAQLAALIAERARRGPELS